MSSSFADLRRYDDYSSKESVEINICFIEAQSENFPPDFDTFDAFAFAIKDGR